MSNTLQCWPSFLAVAAKKSANVLRIDLAIRVKEIFFFPNKQLNLFRIFVQLFFAVVHTGLLFVDLTLYVVMVNFQTECTFAVNISHVQKVHLNGIVSEEAIQLSYTQSPHNVVSTSADSTCTDVVLCMCKCVSVSITFHIFSQLKIDSQMPHMQLVYYFLQQNCSWESEQGVES